MKPSENHLYLKTLVLQMKMSGIQIVIILAAVITLSKADITSLEMKVEGLENLISSMQTFVLQDMILIKGKLANTDRKLEQLFDRIDNLQSTERVGGITEADIEQISAKIKMHAIHYSLVIAVVAHFSNADITSLEEKVNLISSMQTFVLQDMMLIKGKLANTDMKLDQLFDRIDKLQSTEHIKMPAIHYSLVIAVVAHFSNADITSLEEKVNLISSMQTFVLQDMMLIKGKLANTDMKLDQLFDRIDKLQSTEHVRGFTEGDIEQISAKLQIERITNRKLNK
ncbi:hypothetical protein MAR_003104 [Mya arenaria]|uniref:TerB family tellurite resistance protein n=1 Tax=Mya arenaria TaxID=6604 RepID=A0ABY7G931_MYAAR|nr:hypothetical protein MAR_003104 [Mya arenaria]